MAEELLLHPADAPYEDTRRSQRKLYLMVVVASSLAVLSVLCATFGTFGTALNLRIQAADGLNLAIDVAKRDNQASAQTLRNLTGILRFQACCNRHSASIKATHITALSRAAGGYLASSWDTVAREARVHFFSDALAPRWNCPLGGSGVKREWTTQRFFPSSDSAVIFYSDSTLYFVKSKDCSSRSVGFEKFDVRSVLDTSTPNEHLVLYSGADATGKLILRIGLVDSQRKLVWRKNFGNADYQVYNTETSFIRLADSRYALAADDRSTTPSSVCIFTIDLGRQHTDESKVKITANCNRDFSHIYGMAETDSGNLLALGAEKQASHAVVLEISKNRNTFNTRLQLKEGFVVRRFGEIYRVSKEKYAIAVEMCLAGEGKCRGEAYMYDYPANRITKSASINLHEFHPLGAWLSRYGDEGMVLMLNSRDGYIVLPAEGETSFVWNVVDAGFLLMAAAKDGGFVVHRLNGEGQEQQKIWKSYPWLDGGREELDCSGVI